MGFSWGAITTAVSAATRNASNFFNAGDGFASWPDGTLGWTGTRLIGDDGAPAAGGSTPNIGIGGIIATPLTAAAGAYPGTDAPLASSPIGSNGFTYAGGGCPFAYGGYLFMPIHLEQEQNNATTFYGSIGLAYSSDGGATWTYLGQILRPAVAFDATYTASGEVGSGNPVLPGDGYVYVFFQERGFNGVPTNDFCCARVLLTSLLSGGVPVLPTFSKYKSGSFSQAGIGGTCDPLEVGNPYLLWSDVAYHPATNRWIAMHTTNGTGVSFSSSVDGINWTSRQLAYERASGIVVYASLAADTSRNVANPFPVFWQEGDNLNFWDSTGNLKTITVNFVLPVAQPGGVVAQVLGAYPVGTYLPMPWTTTVVAKPGFVSSGPAGGGTSLALPAVAAGSNAWGVASGVTLIPQSTAGAESELSPALNLKLTPTVTAGAFESTPESPTVSAGTMVTETPGFSWFDAPASGVTLLSSAQAAQAAESPSPPSTAAAVNTGAGGSQSDIASAGTAIAPKALAGHSNVGAAPPSAGIFIGTSIPALAGSVWTTQAPCVVLFTPLPSEIGHYPGISTTIGPRTVTTGPESVVGVGSSTVTASGPVTTFKP